MAVTAAQITVGTTRVTLAAGGNAALAVTIRNAGANTIFLGPIGVTTSNGYGLVTAAVISLEIDANDTLYGVAAAAGETAEILRT